MTGWNDDIRPPAPSLALWKTRVALGVLWIEALTAAFWPPVVALIVYAGMALSRLPALIGDKGTQVLAGAFYLVFLFLLVQGFKRFHKPHRNHVLRRLETDNALPHRPLSALDDRAAIGNMALWDAARQKYRDLARSVKPFPPGPVLASRDPWALRYLAALALCVGLVVAGARSPDRLRQAFFPFALSAEEQGANPAADKIVLWITPPAYTGIGQTLFKGSGRVSEPLAVPQGSVFKLRVSGGWGTPAASMGGYSFPLSRLGSDSWGAELMVTPGNAFTLKQFFWTRFKLPYRYVTDSPPTLSLTQEPETLPGGRLRFKLSGRDDYGIRDLALHVQAGEEADAMPALGQPATLIRPLMTRGSKEPIGLEPVYDLSAHPWAGLPVIVHFTAKDALDQGARSEMLRITLPERPFRHPVAQEIVSLRRKLIWTPEAARTEVSRALEEILSRPSLYGGELTVFLALRSAASRLYYNTSRTEIESAAGILWDIALKIDEGDLGLAARALREARQALENALRDPKTSQDDLARLNDRLREAMANYLRELGREMQKRMAEGKSMPALPPEAMSKMLDGRMLESLLDKLQSESLSGNRDQAMEMLSMLEKMTEMLDPSMMGPLPPDIQFMSEGINELQELIQRQEQLLDQTREQARRLTADQEPAHIAPPASPRREGEKIPEMGEMPPPPSTEPGTAPAVDTTVNQVEQEALRRILGTLMRESGEKLGEIPPSMGKAELEMRQSSQALGDNRPDGSVPHQQETLRHLREGAQQLAEQMKTRLSQMTGVGFGAGPLDPLGRPYNDPQNGMGKDPDNSVKLPTESERRRIDDILKTLRQRSGEYDRPQEEIDYLRRLLRQF